MHIRKPLALLSCLAVLAGCGGSSPDFTEEQVAAHLGVEEGSDGTTQAEHCDIAVVLDSKEETDLYKDAGDTVATNDDGTAGVKITDEDEQECLETLTEKLASLGEH